MIDFPAFIQGVFYVFVIMLMIAVVLFFRKPSTQKNLPKERRAFFLLLSLGAIFMITLLIGVKLSSWSSKYRYEKNEFRLEQELNLNEYSFIARTFKPLEHEYRQLRASIQGLDKMMLKIKKLMPHHQNHQLLLQNMLASFETESKLQGDLYKKVNLEIRNAMILSATTQDSASVQNKFYERAKVLHAKIINARARVQKKLGNAAGQLAESLIAARKNLNRYNRKHESKNKKIHLYSFPDTTAQDLLSYLEKYDANLFVTTKKIIKVIIAARQNKDTMQVLSQRETDLKTPLLKTMQLWSDAEIEGQKYWGDILYSLEAAYLADQFNMPHYNPAYRSLMRDLKRAIPEQLNKLEQTQREVKSSFISPNFVENARKNRL